MVKIKKTKNNVKSALPEERFQEAKVRIVMKVRSVSREQALAILSERERQVLKMLFGIGRNEMTAEEVANSLNLTRERVRQIKERALRRLREASNIKILTTSLG